MPVTIFAIHDIKNIKRRRDLRVRRKIEGKDVDFNGKNQNLVVYVFCHLQLGLSCAFYLGEVMKKIIGRGGLLR